MRKLSKAERFVEEVVLAKQREVIPIWLAQDFQKDLHDLVIELREFFELYGDCSKECDLEGLVVGTLQTWVQLEQAPETYRRYHLAVTGSSRKPVDIEEFKIRRRGIGGGFYHSLLHRFLEFEERGLNIGCRVESINNDPSMPTDRIMGMTPDIKILLESGERCMPEYCIPCEPVDSFRISPSPDTQS